MSADAKKIRWGVLGTGKIASDFIGSLKGCPDAEVVAVGARSKASAEQFVQDLGLTAARCYEGYEGVATDASVDVVYVSTLADTHMKLSLMCIENGKAVLVEKPIATNAADAAVLYSKAREAGVFLMEGMWTRCFPAVCKARQLIAEGVIGEVVSVSADFGWLADPDPVNGENVRLFEPIGGGVCMDLGCYPVGHVLLGSGGVAPERVVALGESLPGAEAGSVSDWSASAILNSFPGKPALQASVMVTLRANTPEEAVFIGTKGNIRLHRPAHCPTKVTLSIFESRESVKETEFEFPLPPKPEGTPPYNYPGGEGMMYEAQVVHDALRKGLKEAQEWTHRESVTCMSVVGAMRAAVKAGDGPQLEVPSIQS